MADQGAIGYARQINPRRLAEVFAKNGVGHQVSVRRLARVVSATVRVTQSSASKRIIPQYLEAGVNTLSSDLSAVISGNVQVLGVGVAGYVVNVYYRKTGVLVARTVSGVAGAFSVPNLYRGGIFFVVAVDATYPPATYNAVITDLISAA